MHHTAVAATNKTAKMKDLEGEGWMGPDLQQGEPPQKTIIEEASLGFFRKVLVRTPL